MRDLQALYQEVLLDHYRQPRNFGPLPGATHHAEGHNPLCGDRVEVEVLVVDERLAQVGFQGSGCAISTASASLMTEAVQGLRPEEFAALFAAFRDAVTGATPPDEERLGKLAALAGVREFPMRVKCATLAWHTLQAALAGGDHPISTE